MLLFLLCLLLRCSPVLLDEPPRYYFELYKLGRHFDGIGAISGGATSPLFVNYPEQQKSEILDYLFKPNFGASLQILKVEIGGDGQSADGTELSHMHYPWDENYERGYEWWLMAEAKKRNPNITLYGLPFTYPGWLGGNGSDPSSMPEVTADYVVRWVDGARAHHNLTIDVIGLWNERNMSSDYVKTLRKTLDDWGFNNTKMVAPDMRWDHSSIVEDIQNDPELSAAVHYVGTHFPGTVAPGAAINLTQPLWASADYGTLNDVNGAGCLATTLNRNYVAGYMTATVSWSLVSSFYDVLPLSRQGLVTAAQPWSGHYTVEAPLWVTAHTTQFTEVGWRYLQHQSGVGLLQGGGSYVALLSPDGRDITIVIETLSHKHSMCNRSSIPSYTVVPQNITIQLAGDLAGQLWQINMWYTRLGFDGQPSTLFQKLKPLPVQHGSSTMSLGVDEIYTLTTLDRGLKGQYSPPPASKPFPDIYLDSFESSRVGQQPANFLPQSGAFEVIQSGDEPHGQVVRQMVLDPPVAWCRTERVDRAVTFIGNSDWTDVLVEVDATLAKVNTTLGYFLAARVQRGGCDVSNSTGVFLFLWPRLRTYALYYDFAGRQLIKNGQFSNRLPDSWNRLSLVVKDTLVLGSVNGQLVINVTAPGVNARGLVTMGTDSFGLADFDNLVISAKGENIDRKINSYYSRPKSFSNSRIMWNEPNSGSSRGTSARPAVLLILWLFLFLRE